MFGKKGKYQARKVRVKGADPGIGYVIPFFLVMTLLTVVSFVIPLRPTVSYAEKRELAKFPEFSVETLLDGSYFDDITLWFSDTFPGREGWLELSDYATSLHGYSDIAFADDLILSDDPVEETTEPWTEPSEEPAEDPEESTGAEEEATSGTETTETDATEAPTEAATEPTEDEWGGIQIGDNAQINVGAVIQVDDTAFNQLKFIPYQSERYARILSDLAARLAEKGARVISCPAPTAVGVMVENEYLELLKCSPQDEMMNYIHEHMTEDVITVDTFSNLAEHNDEYIYFRTDHHWTALGAYYAYEALCETLGMEAAPLSSFEEIDQGEFRGTNYGKARWPQKLRLDNVYAYMPQGEITMLLYYNNNRNSVEKPLLADMSYRNVYETYLAFLGGDCPLVEITNESIPDAPVCVVVKDSFGNCFVPFLTQNYYKIYAIDYRAYNEMSLAKFVETFGVQDVIFAPYLTATQGVSGNDLFAFQCR